MRTKKAKAVGVQVAVARDFRVPGQPVGYVVIQAAAYYARWEIHDPETVTIHDPDGKQVQWLALRAGGTVDLAGAPEANAAPVRLSNLDELGRLCQGGREWAGGSHGVERADLVFKADGEGPEHRVSCFPDRIEYSIRMPLKSPCRIRRCTLGLGSDGRRTAIESDHLFNAGPAAHGVYHHPLHMPQYIRPDWFTPPPYAYSFHLRDGTRMTAALEAAVGHMPFKRFLTQPGAVPGQLAFSIEYDSEPLFSGEFVSAPLVFRFGAADEFAALRQHAEGMVADGKVPPVKRTPATWWRGVMACGWHWQTIEGPKRKQDCGAACNQAVYDDMITALEKKGIAFDILTIDMFWGKQHGVWTADTERWPDLRGFIDRQHKRGRRVLLWICTTVTGLPAEELYVVGDRQLLDPLNPRWRKRLAEACRYMFGEAPGCLNADGLKFDFTEMTPPAGEPSRCTRELHGLDYLHALFSAVHDAAKAVREDILLDFQVAHPAFAGLYDMSRLNDFFLPSRQDVRVMRTRSQIAQAVGFGALVDVDGPASEAYFRDSPKFGNMSLYLCADHLADPRLVRAIRASIAAHYRRRTKKRAIQ